MRDVLGPGMKTLPTSLIVALLLAGGLAAPARAERDPHGLAQDLAQRLETRRRSAAIHATDFQGTDIGCIILPRRELRPHGYPGHGFLCEVNGTGEVLGAVLGSKGRKLCEIRGVYTNDFCYDFDICGYAERLCVQ